MKFNQTKDHVRAAANNDRPLEAQAGPADEDRLIGARIRALRKERGLSLQFVSDHSGVSIAMLSQCERGLSAPSIRSLRSIAGTLGVPISWFFLPVPDQSATSAFIVRRAARRALKLTTNRVRKQLLTPAEAGAIEMYEITLEAFGSSGEDSYPHNGVEKAGIVLAGSLRLWLENQVSILGEGDSFRFPSRLAHRFDNPSAEPATVLWIVANGNEG